MRFLIFITKNKDFATSLISSIYRKFCMNLISHRQKNEYSAMQQLIPI